MQRYNPKDIEPKWQQQWAKDKLYEAVDFSDKPKYVMLTEFPYPSGTGIHLGHAREYTYGDIMARHKRMQGYNVLYPMGYDAFGLPTENYAIKNKVTPQKATDDNVANFQSQLEQLGYGIDWARSFRTSDPDYYKWTQWLFLKFFNAGLAYQDEIAINWCPFEKTGLANEEVVNGRHERCGTVVEKKLLKQWLLKITEYADRLIDGLQDVDYPSRIADQQIHWIGRSKGAEITFAVDQHEAAITVFTTRPDTIFGASFLVLAPEHDLVSQITTPEQKDVVNNYVQSAMAKSDVERQDTDRQKTGVFTGAYALNPASGEKLPIWIADYVLNGYGTGAIMAVPAHDERDYDFARKFNLAVQPVVAPSFGEYDASAVDRPTALVVGYDPQTDKYCLLDWRPKPGTHKKSGMELPGGGIDEGETIEAAAIREFVEETGYTDVTVKAVEPLVYGLYYISTTADGKPVAKRAVKTVVSLTVNSLAQATIGKESYEMDSYDVLWLTKEEIETSDKLLPLDKQVLESIWNQSVVTTEGTLANSGKYNGMPSAEAREKIVADLAEQGAARERVTYRLRDWVFSRQHYWGEPIPIIHCAEHGAVPVPEDQLPVTLPKVEQYEPTDTGESPLSAITEWVNTECPTCGQPAKRETDTMPNWAGSSWYYLRYFDARNDEAFADHQKLDYWGGVDMYLGGMEHTTLHLLYSRFWHQFLYDQKLVPTPEPYLARRGQGIILAADGTKMSKSKGNVVNPTEIIDSGYGADALRLAIAFLAPYDQTTPWSPESVAGTYRFLQRIWSLVQEHTNPNTPHESAATGQVNLLQPIHRSIKKVSEDLGTMSFNTAIAGLMELVNELYKLRSSVPLGSPAWREPLINLIQLLAPLAPHIAEELWQQLEQTGSVHQSSWPNYDEEYLKSDVTKIVVQVNGKVRGVLTTGVGQSEAQVMAAARAEANVESFLDGKEIRKTIFIADKLLNIVV